MDTKYLQSVKQQMLYYKSLADKSIAQLSSEQLFERPNEESNSIAMIIQHMHGNMLSRWTDFLTSDGEKEWRQRDAEFEEVLRTKEEVLQKWEEGWSCLMNTLNELADTQLADTVLIRNEPHTVTEAINRQLAHYPYHVGQIVFYVKALLGSGFKSLSIAKNQSQQFNEEKFGKS
ncbi:MAG: DUF1572 family protein [Ferruginibacter sp.]